ncbi:MAG TPA: HAMP domain-containing sensor histidine kinase, partial [Polyangiaceae bacterium]|nr:HAMP domain-containing sensor histidine kinase [Polyangiaceae bacterium]
MGRKRERPTHSAAEKGGASNPAEAKRALERLSAAHTACAEFLGGGPYAAALGRLAQALSVIFSAKLVVIRDSPSPLATGLAPVSADIEACLEGLNQAQNEEANAAIPSLDDVLERLAGFGEIVKIPLTTSRGQGSLWLGFGSKLAWAPEEHTSLALLGQHLSLVLSQAVDRNVGSLHRPSVAASQRPLEELVSLAAHELRTPLTPITMLLQSLERKAKSGTVDPETIQRTRRQVNRLTQMISDLLDVSRLRRSCLVLTPTSFDLASVVAAAVTAHNAKDGSRRVECVSLDGPAQVTADEVRAQQSIGTLLDHLVRTTPADRALFVEIVRTGGRAHVCL